MSCAPVCCVRDRNHLRLGLFVAQALEQPVSVVWHSARQTAALALKHDVLAHNTRAQFRQVMDTLRELMVQPEPKRRPIGFVHPKE